MGKKSTEGQWNNNNYYCCQLRLRWQSDKPWIKSYRFSTTLFRTSINFQNDNEILSKYNTELRLRWLIENVLFILRSQKSLISYSTQLCRVQIVFLDCRHISIRPTQSDFPGNLLTNKWQTKGQHYRTSSIRFCHVTAKLSSQRKTANTVKF